MIVDVDALLALGSGLDHRAVGFDVRDGEELRGLLLPDFQTRHVEGCLQGGEVFARKTPAEVACRGGIGNSLGAQEIQIGFVLPPQLEVFQALRSAQPVVGQVQDVVRLVVRQMHLEQMQALVDRLGQSQLTGQLLHQSDAAVGRADATLGQFVMQLAAAQHRPREIVGKVVLVEPPRQTTLASGDSLPNNLLHSNPFLVAVPHGASTPMKPRARRRSSSFFAPPPLQRKRIRLFEG